MTTYKRICVKDYTISAENGDTLTLARGKEYITSGEHDGLVTVFSSFWEKVPANLFAGEVLFTRGALDYRNPPRTLRADRLSELDEQLASLRAVLAPLRELAAKATPPPWTEDDNGIHERASGETLAQTWRKSDESDFKNAAANRRLIIALRNALPALLAALPPETPEEVS